MPQDNRGVLFIGFALGEADEFALHAPGGQEILPALTEASVLRGHNLSHELHTVTGQIVHRHIQVVYVKSEVVPTQIRIRGLGSLGFGCFPLENLKIGAIFTAEESQLAHDGARVDVELLSEPIVVFDKRAQAIDLFAADYVHKKTFGLIKVRNRKADVLGSS